MKINRNLNVREIAIGEERAVQYLRKIMNEHRVGEVIHYRIFSQVLQTTKYEEKFDRTIYTPDVDVKEHFMILEMYKEKLESYKNEKPEIIFTTKVNIKDFLNEEDYTDCSENENTKNALSFKKHEFHIKSIYYNMLYNDNLPKEYTKIALEDYENPNFAKEVDLMIFDVALETFKENVTTGKISNLLLERLKYFTFKREKVEVLFRKDLNDPWEHVSVYKNGSVVLSLEDNKLDCDLVLTELANKTNLYEYTYNEIE